MSKVNAQGFPIVPLWLWYWCQIKALLRGPQCDAMRPTGSQIRPGFTMCRKRRVWHFGPHCDHWGDQTGPWIEPHHEKNGGGAS